MKRVSLRIRNQKAKKARPPKDLSNPVPILPSDLDSSDVEIIGTVAPSIVQKLCEPYLLRNLLKEKERKAKNYESCTPISLQTSQESDSSTQLHAIARPEYVTSQNSTLIYSHKGYLYPSVNTAHMRVQINISEIEALTNLICNIV